MIPNLNLQFDTTDQIWEKDGLILEVTISYLMPSGLSVPTPVDVVIAPGNTFEWDSSMFSEDWVAKIQPELEKFLVDNKYIVVDKNREDISESMVSKYTIDDINKNIERTHGRYPVNMKSLERFINNPYNSLIANKLLNKLVEWQMGSRMDIKPIESAKRFGDVMEIKIHNLRVFAVAYKQRGQTELIIFEAYKKETLNSDNTVFDEAMRALGYASELYEA